MKVTRNLVRFLLGSIAILVPNALDLYWGTASVYVFSFLRSRGAEASDMGAPWLPFLYFLAWSLGQLVAGQVSKRIDTRIVMAVGILIFLTGVFCTYWTLLLSLMWVNVTLGALPGLGGGMIRNAVFKMTLEIAPNDMGVVSSLIQICFTIGIMIIPQAITRYTNPDNLAPDVTFGRFTLFSSAEILDKVRNIPLILGVTLMSFQVTGFALLSFDCKKKTDSERRPLQPEEPMETTTLSTQKSDGGAESSTEPAKSLTARQMVKTREFYILWIASAAACVNFAYFYANYKTFAMNWIKDDQFYADLTTVFSVTNIGLRLFWGLLCDKTEAKTSLIMCTAMSSLFSGLFYFTPGWNKWIYFVWTILYSGITSHTTIIYPYATASQFGHAHFATNLSIVMTSFTASSLLAPEVDKFILETFGWFAVFFSFGLQNAIVLLLVVLFYRDKRRYNFSTTDSCQNKWSRHVIQNDEEEAQVSKHVLSCPSATQRYGKLVVSVSRE